MLFLAKSMRIALIGQKGLPAIYGGIERHVEELGRELVSQGHEVLAYARAWYTPKTINNCFGIKVIHTLSLPTKHLDTITHTLLATLDAIKRDVNIIHYHGVGPALWSWLPRLFAPKIKVIVTFHSLDRFQYKWGFVAKMVLRLGEYFACTFPHQTITVSRVLYNYCLNNYQTRTNYIPNGVRTPRASFAPTLLHRFNLQPEKYILIVARLIKDKGVHHLIEAWQIARQKNDSLKDKKLVIVGGADTDKEYVARLELLARGDNSIVFTGWQHGQMLAELYANCHLFVHASENEGLPIAVLEAMSYAKPVLVSDIPAHQEIIHDQKFWFNTANIIALSNKLSELINKDADLAMAGKNNAIVAATEYNWKDIAKKTEEIYLLKTTEKLGKLKLA